jgi:hypothetical protein
MTMIRALKILFACGEFQIGAEQYKVVSVRVCQRILQ